MAAYASIADWKARGDIRLIGELMNDDGTRSNSAAIDADANGVLAAALAGASGELEAALSASDRYLPADLAALTDNSLALLKDLTVELAKARLWRRKKATERDKEARMEAIETAAKIISKLEKGQYQFIFPEAQDASHPSASLPTTIQYQNANSMTARWATYNAPVATRARTR